jgi:hypothetical protein
VTNKSDKGPTASTAAAARIQGAANRKAVSRTSHVAAANHGKSPRRRPRWRRFLLRSNTNQTSIKDEEATTRRARRCLGPRRESSSTSDKDNKEKPRQWNVDILRRGDCLSIRPAQMAAARKNCSRFALKLLYWAPRERESKKSPRTNRKPAVEAYRDCVCNTTICKKSVASKVQAPDTGEKIQARKQTKRQSRPSPHAGSYESYKLKLLKVHKDRAKKKRRHGHCPPPAVKLLPVIPDMAGKGTGTLHGRFCVVVRPDHALRRRAQSSKRHDRLSRSAIPRPQPPSNWHQHQLQPPSTPPTASTVANVRHCQRQGPPQQQPQRQ